MLLCFYSNQTQKIHFSWVCRARATRFNKTAKINWKTQKTVSLLFVVARPIHSVSEPLLTEPEGTVYDNTVYLPNSIHNYKIVYDVMIRCGVVYSSSQHFIHSHVQHFHFYFTFGVRWDSFISSFLCCYVVLFEASTVRRGNLYRFVYPSLPCDESVELYGINARTIARIT